jgi:hypothetical protein
MGLSVGCGSKNQEAALENEQYALILTEIKGKQEEQDQSEAEVDSSVKITAATDTPIPAPIDVPVPTAQVVNWVESAAAGEHLGEIVTVRVQLSHCSYKPGVNGEPTFCNDQPYPNHVFTYLVWGQDWSHFDQACVLVRGEIVEYDGKAQIELENEEQILLCDGT